ncbi:MAG: DUF4143 domain-containing protein [Candidatus Babeliales bacterium]
MPAAVAEYVKHDNFSVARVVQLEILNAYERDFAKHAPPQEVMKITTVWNQVHRQLAKENKKFSFSAIRKSSRGRDYVDAIQWLVDAGLLYKNNFVEVPKFPLSAYADTIRLRFFCLMLACLAYKSLLSARMIIEGNSLFTEFKGALTENHVAQELVASGSKKLYYWASEGTAELDFLFEDDHEIYPLEAEAGESQRKKSLLVYGQKYNPSVLYRTTLMN